MADLRHNAQHNLPLHIAPPFPPLVGDEPHRRLGRQLFLELAISLDLPRELEEIHAAPGAEAVLRHQRHLRCMGCAWGVNGGGCRLQGEGCRRTAEGTVSGGAMEAQGKGLGGARSGGGGGRHTGNAASNCGEVK
jgi:hypothetical protein